MNEDAAAEKRSGETQFRLNREKRWEPMNGRGTIERCRRAGSWVPGKVQIDTKLVREITCGNFNFVS